MGGCCGAMKTGQKSLPDKKKSADAIQEKPNGKEAAQATVSVSANDTGKAFIGEGAIHAEVKPKDVDSPTQEQISVPVKVSVSHAEPTSDAVEPPGVQVAENVMDLDTAVAPFESLPPSSAGDNFQQEAQGSITSAEPEVLLPFQIPVQHTFTSTTATTTATTIGHEETQEEFKLRVDEPQLESAFPGGVQLSITENVQTAPFEEEAPAAGEVEILAKSFAAAEVETLPEPPSADRVEAGAEDAVARVERAILEAQLPVEEDLPPPPPLDAPQPDELEAGFRFEVDASLPVPAPLEVSIEPEPKHDPHIQICPLERRPEPERRPDAGIQICPLERKPEREPRPDSGIQICPLERGPEPEPIPDAGVQICPLEQEPFPEPSGYSAGVVICPEERIPYPGPRHDSGIQICPLERGPEPEPILDAGVQICPLEQEPFPEPTGYPAGVVICPEERIPYPGPSPDSGIQICPLERGPEPVAIPDAGIQICPLEQEPFPEPTGYPAGVVICPEERIPYPGPSPDSGIQICPPVLGPYSGFTISPIPDPDIAICPPEEPIPEPEIAVCPPEPELAINPPFTGDNLAEAVEQSKTLQEEVTSAESSFQQQVPVELGFGSGLEEVPQIAADEDFPPPAVEESAISDSLLESYEVLNTAAENLPQPPVEQEDRSAEPIISLTENEQFSEQPLQDLTAVSVHQKQEFDEPAAYQDQQVDGLEPYHEQLQSQEPTPYQEPLSQSEHQGQDVSSQQLSGTFEESGNALQTSFQEREQQPRETDEPLPVLEVVSEQVQQSRDAWWDESGKDQSGQQTTDDVPVLELVSEQVREAHQIWWNQSENPTNVGLSEEAVTSTIETAQPLPTEQGSSTEESSSIPSSGTQLEETAAAAPIPPPEETPSPIADGSFPDAPSEQASSSSDLVAVKEGEVNPETKEFPIVESPLSADGSSTVPTENGEVSTLSSDETSVSNLSPEGIDDPTSAAVVATAAASTKEPIPAQA